METNCPTKCIVVFILRNTGRIFCIEIMRAITLRKYLAFALTLVSQIMGIKDD
jgi:hypothetical protein